MATTLGTEFDNFLYAPIDEANDQVPFSVLSALARQNVDPWEEAAVLALLPKESAILRLSTMISSLTIGRTPRSDPTADATRLVALLPRSAKFNIPRFDRSLGEVPRDFTPLIIYFIIGAMIIASALFGG
jgi:hypothetical protein